MFDKSELLAQRGQFCECGCNLYAHDAHHCFIPNLKRFSQYLNDERNIVLVNHSQHIARIFDNREWRNKFWKRQVLRYGNDKMNEWIKSLPDKLRYRIDWLDK